MFAGYKLGFVFNFSALDSGCTLLFLLTMQPYNLANWKADIIS